MFARSSAVLWSQTLPGDNTHVIRRCPLLVVGTAKLVSSWLALRFADEALASNIHAHTPFRIAFHTFETVRRSSRLLRFFSQADTREALSYLSTQERLTVFVGAGCGKEVGLPTWTELVKTLAIQAVRTATQVAAPRVVAD